MSMSIEEVLRKADLQLADLRANGGAMNESQAAQFFEDATIDAPLLDAARTTSQKAITDKLPKIKFAGRISHRATDGEALAIDDRSAPTISEVSITTTEFKAEIDLTDGELLENVEGNNLLNRVKSMATRQIGIDTQENMVRGDTTSATYDLAAFDGCRELVTSYIVDCAGAALSEDKLIDAIKLLPERYAGSLDGYRFAMARNVELNYRKDLASRVGLLGDLMLTKKDPISIGGVPFQIIPGWPTNLGLTGDRSDALLVDWKNFIISYWRTITFETERMARAGKTAIIFTYRVGCQYEEEQAVVKLEDILAS